VSRQYLLDLAAAAAPSFDNFVAGAGNAELLSSLHALADGGDIRALYLWGPPGSGRSHLLAATAARAAGQRPCLRLAAAALAVAPALPRGALLAIDDVDDLDAAGQQALFACFIAAPAERPAMLLTGARPPLRLALREDLRTRIGQALVYEIRPLSDADKLAALQNHARERGMRLDPGVLEYLLRHRRRDLPALMTAVDALDRASLELQRPPTLPLLREILPPTQSPEEPSATHGPRPL